MATKKVETKQSSTKKSAPTPASRITRAKTEAPKLSRPAHQPSYDEIAHRAYEYYVRRGCAHGHHLEDWYRAEMDLRTGR